jgi:hypothetical protein
MVGAVIYVRVSTKEQTENLSLPTQLRACEEYCRRQGYEILERFHEEGESAKSTDRSQLQNLLTYCRLNKGRVPSWSCSTSRASRTTRVRGVRDWPIHEGTVAQAGQALGPHEPAREAAHVTSDRRAAAQPALRGHDRRARGQRTR